MCTASILDKNIICIPLFLSLFLHFFLSISSTSTNTTIQYVIKEKIHRSTFVSYYLLFDVFFSTWSGCCGWHLPGHRLLLSIAVIIIAVIWRLCVRTMMRQPIPVLFFLSPSLYCSRPRCAAAGQCVPSVIITIFCFKLQLRDAAFCSLVWLLIFRILFLRFNTCCHIVICRIWKHIHYAGIFDDVRLLYLFNIIEQYFMV